MVRAVAPGAWQDGPDGPERRRSSSSSSSRPASATARTCWPAAARRSSSIRSATRGASSRSRSGAAGESGTSSRRTSTTTTCPARSRPGPRRGAEIVAPARGGYEFEHRPVDEGDWLEIGGLRLTAWATPGHTPEHLAWLVTAAGTSGEGPDDGQAIFTGGSLLVGSVGRTDLLGPVADGRAHGRPAALARAPRGPAGRHPRPADARLGQLLQRRVRSSTDRTTTIDAERVANPTFALAAAPADDFRVQALEGLGRVPDYYAHMARINRRGPRVLGRLILPPALDPAAFEAAAAAGATIVDARDRDAFAAGHIRGSLNIELESAFSGYVGWLVRVRRAGAARAPRRAPMPSRRRRPSCCASGTSGCPAGSRAASTAWAASGRPLASYATTTMADVHRQRAAGDGCRRAPRRAPAERVGGRRRAGLRADLRRRPAGPASPSCRPAQPVTVFCRTGHRASMAASVLDNAGFDVTLVDKGGAAAWPAPLEPVPPARGSPRSTDHRRLARPWTCSAGCSRGPPPAPTTRRTRRDLADVTRVRPALPAASLRGDPGGDRAHRRSTSSAGSFRWLEASPT